MEASRSIRPGHTGLVGLPVFLTMLFCFALVLAHPNPQAAGSKNDTNDSPPVGTASMEPAIDVKPVAQAKLVSSNDADEVVSSGSPVAAAGDDSRDDASDKTSTPQPGNHTNQSLQMAGQYHEGERIHIGRVHSELNGILD